MVQNYTTQNLFLRGSQTYPTEKWRLSYCLSVGPIHPLPLLASRLTLTELIDKCVGSRIWIVMKGDKGQCSPYVFVPLCLDESPYLNLAHSDCKSDTRLTLSLLEFAGTLLGFDDYVSTFYGLFAAFPRTPML